MSFKDFLSRFKKAGKKETLQEQLRGNTELLKNVVIPSYKTASVKAFGRSVKFKDTNLQGMEISARRLIKGFPGGNMVDGFAQRLDKLDHVTGTLSDLVDSHFNPDILPETATYQQANLLQLCDMVRFVVDYAPTLLSYIYVLETASTLGSDSNDELTAGDRKYVTSNFVKFCTAINTLAVETQALRNALRDVPAVVVAESNENALQASMGIKRFDPLNVGFISLDWHPMSFIWKIVANIEVSRYERAQAQRLELQLRLQQLLQAQRDNPSPVIDKEIESIRMRIDRLSAKIREEEQSVQ